MQGNIIQHRQSSQQLNSCKWHWPQESSIHECAFYSYCLQLLFNGYHNLEPVSEFNQAKVCSSTILCTPLIYLYCSALKLKTDAYLLFVTQPGPREESTSATENLGASRALCGSIPKSTRLDITFSKYTKHLKVGSDKKILVIIGKGRWWNKMCS